MKQEHGRRTQTIKERAIYVYLPSFEMVQDWKSRAEKSGVSISKFVIERVEDSLQSEDKRDESYLNRAELAKKLKQSEEDLKEVRNENRLLRQLAENLDKELRRYRAQPFLEDSFEGIRKFDKDIIGLLKKGGSYTQEQILSALNIDPSESDVVKAISRQLEALEGYGLVDYRGRGWKWKP